MKDLTVLREKFDNHEMILPEEFSDLLDRLEQAEQAVARVREVATEMANHTMPDEPKGSAWILAEGAQLFARDVIEALDGDGRG